MALTTVQSGMMDSVAQYYTFKNRIINGAMVIDQRNAGTSFTPTTTSMYSLDRWGSYVIAASKYSIQQNAGSVTPPVGFTNYLGLTSLTALSVASSDYYALLQGVEGYNIADFGWGTANAATVTLSFWVRSSLTGTFGGAIRNNDGNRSYPFSYTISAANTWEYKTITIPGDTTGTWLTTNSVGLYLYFGIGVGATYAGTAGAWVAANYVSATGATNPLATNGATWYITGVQIEKGVTATSFDYRPIGTELQLCQRYFEKTYAQGVKPGTAGVVGYNTNGGLTNLNTAAHGCRGYSSFRVIKRATPTVVCYDTLGNNGKVNFPDTTANVTIGYQDQVDSGFIVEAASASSADGRMYWHWTATAEL
jgi:hypothetical protein